MAYLKGIQSTTTWPRLLNSTAVKFQKRALSVSIPRCSVQEEDAVRNWAERAKSSRVTSWDRMDPRQLTLFDQTIRPHLPSNYLQHKADAKFGDIVEGTKLPPAAYLTYFPPSQTEPNLSSDGYLYEEAPPAPFVQRVWAGGIMDFNTKNPLKVGVPASLSTSIGSVSIKPKPDGSSLIFVKQKREMRNDKGISVTEVRDLAYMKPTELKRKVIKLNRTPDFKHSLTPTEILLFRYSALTWNSHRIHYDYPYAHNVESHPGLLVHGPLTCTLLLNLLDANLPSGMALKSFSYRAISPMYCQQQLTLNGRWKPASTDSSATKGLPSGATLCELWAENNEGGVSMKGTAVIVPTES